MPGKTHRLEVDDGRAAGRTDWARVDALTDAEVEVAARADPDCPPLGEGKTLHRMAQAKRIRLRLRLDQRTFAERYQIAMATLVAWERHESEPDAMASAYLAAISADAAGVARAIESAARQVQAE